MSKLPMILKILRKENNLSQEAIAQQLNISIQAYSRYEKGTAEPNVEKLIKLADFFKMSLDEIVGRDFKQEGKSLNRILLKNQINTEIKGIIKEVIEEIVKQRESEIKDSIYRRLEID